MRATKLCYLIVEINRQQHAISDNTRHDQPHRQSPFHRTGRAVGKIAAPIADAAIVADHKYFAVFDRQARERHQCSAWWAMAVTGHAAR